MYDGTEIHRLSTEQANRRYHDLDQRTTLNILGTINAEDATVAGRVAEVLPRVAEVVDTAAARMRQGGRLFYVGAGSAGRIGMLDAAECVPTFGTSPDWVQAVIAGGLEAMATAVENAEDIAGAGRDDLAARGIGPLDTVIGLSASGRTPYVVGALEHARMMGAYTVAISNNLESPVGQLADTAVEIDTGPEILAGSTRLKASTAQKMVLNMISTALMIRLGRVYQNLMVEVRSTNEKLVDRAKRIVMAASGLDFAAAEVVYEAAQGNVKAAIVMARSGQQYRAAVQLLEASNGSVRDALRSVEEARPTC